MEREIVERPSESGWFSGWLRWCPTSSELLEAAEARILKSLDTTFKGCYVKSQQEKIWTVVFNPDGANTPVFMIHGLGAGLGMWVMNIKELSEDRPVYTFDLLGFGRSSRPTFNEDARVVEETFVDSIEDTRRELGLKNFILIGHSFGGYLAYSYAIKYPEQVKSMILLDPWGFTEKTQDWEKNVAIPKWIKLMAAVMSPFNPYAMLRFVGPLGPSILRTTRPDLQRKYSSVFSDDTIVEYIYHCNAQTPSGETGFKALTIPYLWPRYPMMHRMEELSPQLKVTLVFGSRTWIDELFSEFQANRPEQFQILTIKNAGHHIFADRPDEFNKVVKEVFIEVDKVKSQAKGGMAV